MVFLGYFVDNKGNRQKWYYDNGESGGSKCIIPKGKRSLCTKKSKPKIAVLIGSRTASSGEMTAISFKGKPNVKLFGSSSAGYTTGNGGITLLDGSYIYLASGYVTDREGNKYLKKN